MADVLVTENIRGAAMDVLRQQLDVDFLPDLWKDREQLRLCVAGIRALIVRNQTQVTAELIRSAPRLEIIARAGVGLDNIDVQAASEAGIVVAWTPIQNSLSVAEFTLGLMLALARRIPAADRHVKSGGWDRPAYTGSELYGKVLGVVGYGRIGHLTALRARAFGMDVLAHDPLVDADSLAVAETRAALLELDSLLQQADFVTCHLPGGASTRRIFTYERFCRMKPTAFFINVARGEVVDEPGLLQALQEGRLAGAALDVRESEPPQRDPFCDLDNVILLPHIGAFTDEAQDRVVASVCRDVQAVLQGGRAGGYANFPTPCRSRKAPV